MKMNEKKSKLIEYKNMYVVILPEESHVICMGSDGTWDDDYYNYNDDYYNYNDDYCNYGYDYYDYNYDYYNYNYNYYNYDYYDYYAPNISNVKPKY